MRMDISLRISGVTHTVSLHANSPAQYALLLCVCMSVCSAVAINII